MSACYCTGACRKPPYHCPASGPSFFPEELRPGKAEPPTKIPVPQPYGWTCGKCGASLSPYTAMCPCSQPPIVVTCNG